MTLSSNTGLSVTRRWLDPNRPVVHDVVWLARNVPIFPVERVFDLAVLNRLRAECDTRIGWAAMFMKAHAIVAREMPMLRSWYVPWPRPRIVTCSTSVAALSINRQIDGTDWLYWAHIPNPDQMPLDVLQAAITRYQTSPVDQVFKRQQQLRMLPRWLRRLLLRWNINSPGAKRAKRLGTFSISTLAGAGAYNRLHPSPLTTSLAYGPLERNGHCLVTMLCDHRLLDGVPAARAIERLEQVLRDEIAAELRLLRTSLAAE